MIYDVHCDWKYTTFKPASLEDERFKGPPLFYPRQILSPTWSELELSSVEKHKESDFSEIFHCGPGIGVHPRLMEMKGVQDELLACGELLPARFEGESRWIFNCIHEINVINEELTHFKIYNDYRTTNYPVFDIAKTSAIDTWFFRIPESCSVLYATQQFYDFYTKNNLKGLRLDPQKMG
jgi:hypothetical protein